MGSARGSREPGQALTGAAISGVLLCGVLFWADSTSFKLRKSVVERRTGMHRYSIVVFLGAFLLFQVQPLVARVLLPWFGGTASVWNTCMMFFQVALVLGYLYAHGLRIFLTPARSWMVHSVVLLLALLTLPVLPSDSHQPQGEGSPSGEIVRVLTLSVGLPFFVLATTGPLIQTWQSVSGSGSSDQQKSHSPYRLYALSNTGSLLALLSYPFCFETFFRIQTQSTIWTVLFVLFVAICIFSGWQLRNVDSWHVNQGPSSGTAKQKIRAWQPVLWLVLSMIPSMMLLATTNLMCAEIASVPLLWILPLAIYLCSFIICFEFAAYYRRSVFVPLLFLGVIAGLVIALVNANASAALQIALPCFSLFACCMSCHGELEKLKPHASRLTLFYLFVSVGGSLGGIFVVLIAPRLFAGFAEFQIGLIASLLMGLSIVCWSSSLSRVKKYAIGFAGIVVGGITTASLIATLDSHNLDGVLFAGRNEYGIYSVKEFRDRRIFISGTIDHGSQIFRPQPSLKPHSYYADGSGFSVCVKVQRDLAGSETPARDGIRVGVLGLGIGSMLSWAEPQDSFVFYEINPQVETIAREWFTFLPSFDQQSEVIIGDGRIELENELAAGNSRQFDVLAIDAFSSDSIPIHLLTEECFQVYQQHLKQDGILLFHVSNRFIDLKPVLFRMADWNQLQATYIYHSESPGHSGSHWVLVCREAVAQHDLIKSAAVDYVSTTDVAHWTDDFASVTPLIDWSFGIDWESMLQKARQNATSQNTVKQ